MPTQELQRLLYRAPDDVNTSGCYDCVFAMWQLKKEPSYNPALITDAETARSQFQILA